MEMVSTNYRNLIKIVRAVLRKIEILCYGGPSVANILGDRIFIITAHGPTMWKLLNVEYE
jgi:hypothetical protein